MPKKLWDPSQRAFTLLELLIVLGIVALAGVLTQSWLSSQLPKWRLNGAVRQLVSDLQAAKMKAVTERNRQRLIFQGSHQYLLLDDDNNNGSPDPGEQVEHRDIQKEYHDVVVLSTNNPSFLPRGTASNLATITVSNQAGRRTITVSITGRVKVKA